MTGERMQDLLKSPVPAPLLKSSVTGLIGGVPTQEVFPGSSRAKNPQDAIEHVPWIAPWPPPAVRSLSRLRKQRFDEVPLLFGEVHAIPLRGGEVIPARDFELLESDNSVNGIAQRIYEIASRLGIEARVASERTRPASGLVAVPWVGQRDSGGLPA